MNTKAETKMIETPLKHKFDNKMISMPAIMEEDQTLKTEALVEHDTLRICYDGIKTSSKSLQSQLIDEKDQKDNILTEVKELH